MGYQKIVLAGCPMDQLGHWYGLDGEEDGVYWDDQDREVWHDFVKMDEAKKVKSFSGFTKDVLGVPTDKWLKIQSQ